jgi:hypothetical protein
MGRSTFPRSARGTKDKDESEPDIGKVTGALVHSYLSGRQDSSDSFEHPLETRDFLLEVLRACIRDLVNSDAAVRRRHAPACFNQTALEHALQRRVERPFFHLQEVVRHVLDVLRQRVPV